MIITTTPTIEGKKIVRYHDVIAGESVMGANIFKDLFANIRDIIGGRSGTYEKELQRARDAAHEDLVAVAMQIGANAVVGVDIDYEVLSSGGTHMLLVSMSGTAVTVE